MFILSFNGKFQDRLNGKLEEKYVVKKQKVFSSLRRDGETRGFPAAGPRPGWFSAVAGR
jgi:hypothetical protein